MRPTKLILLSFLLLAFTSSVYTVTYEDVTNVIKLAFLNRSKTAATDDLKKLIKSEFIKEDLDVNKSEKLLVFYNSEDESSDFFNLDESDGILKQVIFRIYSRLSLP